MAFEDDMDRGEEPWIPTGTVFPVYCDTRRFPMKAVGDAA